MPNWCSNKVTFTHNDHAQIKRLVETYNQDRLFAEFHPCPQELLNTVAGSHGDPGKQAELEKQEQANRESYGYANWYDWCVANWGTKWDVNTNGDTAEVEDGELAVEVWFDTAWSPPIGFYEHMESLGFKVDAFYHEPGVGFCGRYTAGDDECIEIEGDADWVRSNVPIEIDDAFSISDLMEEWDDDDDEEEKED